MLLSEFSLKYDGFISESWVYVTCSHNRGAVETIGLLWVFQRTLATFDQIMAWHHIVSAVLWISPLSAGLFALGVGAKWWWLSGGRLMGDGRPLSAYVPVEYNKPGRPWTLILQLTSLFTQLGEPPNQGVGNKYICVSVNENHRTCRTFPMARPKCLMRDFTNLWTMTATLMCAVLDSGSENAAHFNGLVQERRNSIANALELRLSCTKPSIYPIAGVARDLLMWRPKHSRKTRSISWLLMPWWCNQ